LVELAYELTNLKAHQLNSLPAKQLTSFPAFYREP
jgi:hypothetical protein